MALERNAMDVAEGLGKRLDGEAGAAKVGNAVKFQNAGGEGHGWADR